MDTRRFAPGLIVLAIVSIGQVRAEDTASLKSAFSQTKLILDTRLRTEDVDQAGIANEASATTLRARLGFETGKVWGTSLLVEGEAVVPLEDDYRPDPLDPVDGHLPGGRGSRILCVQPFHAHQHQHSRGPR